MAKKKHTGRRKQGVVSWITSVLALILGLFPAWRELVNTFNGRQDITGLAYNLNQSYNPLAGNKDRLKEAYGALLGGIVFKVATSELAKRAKVTSVIPALHG